MTSQILTSLQATVCEDGAVVTVSGILVPLTFAITRQGRTWAYGRLRDEAGSIELLVFPNLFEIVRESLIVGARAVVRGRMDYRDSEPRLMAHELRLVDSAPHPLSATQRRSGSREGGGEGVA
jgi:DNA polymerase III subunit alpha